MAKFLAKLSEFGGQHRVTLPKGLIDECGWKGVEYVILERIGFDEIRLRRFIDGESLKNDDKADRPGSH